MDTENRLFFIVSAPRSASTAIATICNHATNCRVAIEPDMPSKWVSRHLMDGKREDVGKWIKGVRKRVKRNLKEVEIYGEKDVTYGPMIPWLYQEFGCKFIYLYRNQNQAVDSMLRWHREITGCLYRECKERGPMSPQAVENEKRVDRMYERDWWDYSRPRPHQEDITEKSWSSYSLRAMTSFYYYQLNRIYESAFLWVPPKKMWIQKIDFIEPGNLFAMTKWLWLGGLTSKFIAEMLDARINSVESRKI